MNTNFLISVIIPTRNRCNLLPRAIDSVINQGYENLEVIIVDDASNDATSDVANKYANRFRIFKYIQNIKPYGGAQSRNIGIQEASGKYIAFLDDDDEWLPDKLLKQIKALEDNRGFGAASCWFYRAFNGKRQEVKLIPEISLDYLLWENFMGSFSCCIARSEIAKSIKLDAHLRSSQDYQFWIELSKITRIYIVKEYLLNYYDHTGERIGSSYVGKYSGLRKMYFKYRNDMSAECRRYRLTYLIIYRVISFQSKKNNSLICLLRMIRKYHLFRNNISRFIIKKIILLRVDKVLMLNLYDSFWETYKFSKRLNSKNRSLLLRNKLNGS